MSHAVVADDREEIVVSTSAGATHNLAASLAHLALRGDLICLWGELGAGKTVFAKGFGAGLGIRDTISSPTFVLMAEYAGRLPLFHIDLYRLAGAEDALAGGLLDERQAAGVTLLEWPDRLGDALPAERLDVRLDGFAAEERRITVSAVGPSLGRFVAAARTWDADSRRPRQPMSTRVER
ncbi:MAG: tRNA (adenosine(37)-N6)-threonylcarbamoyltransferase complex ATPase subunit type 1 TsaE [Chloroflexi bacterium]|nr:tRNA (adenosine(37)-N6)-threonylcarbamoyltransferase complex ATPase subunit type 1 TsaE [Chloroflexota bacterium]